ncbi:aquaporin family protein [Labrys sp. LIt4]|uniref:Aquaporin n=1 Tax=Labrys okinawensis TaxID=346911 RepID=A0A2S9QBG1_9HYPH|nr:MULTISPECIES: MIP/aquaporin family protein [Labrys]MBP0583151.1 aquaporin family protein [Labrys sp. LIt4]PRH86687.1 aquaporin [Labrys okinawensis]
MAVGFVGELMGTATLILFGDGVVANVLLAKNKGQNSGWIVITAGWAFAVLCGVLVAVAAGAPGHLNPAVTLAFATATGDWSNVVPFIAAQFIGAFIGAILVWLAHLMHWGETEDQGLKLAVFCTGPAIRNYGANLVTEIIGGFALLFVVAAIGSKAVATPGYLAPFIVGMVVWGIGVSLGGPTGYAINPARDLGPRIAHAVLPIAGKGGSDWGYSWVPVVGPVIGGIVALMLAKATGMM